MAGAYKFYIGDVSKRESNGYIRARRLMKLLLKQGVCNIKYIEYLEEDYGVDRNCSCLLDACPMHSFVKEQSKSTQCHNN